MNKIIAAALALTFSAGCGANLQFIKAAEVACLAADWATLQAKLKQGGVPTTGSAGEVLGLALSEGEIVCALEALTATAPVGSGS